MKPARRRIEVNLEELDRVLDGARQTPLSETDYDKLKGALHALAAMLAPSRRTEKTRAVLEESEGSETDSESAADTQVPPPPGHGRNRAWAFNGARKVDIAHPKLAHGDRCPECGKGNVYGQQQPKFLVRVVGQAPLAAPSTRPSVYAAVPADRCLPLPSRKEWVRKSTTRRRRR